MTNREMTVLLFLAAALVSCGGNGVANGTAPENMAGPAATAAVSASEPASEASPIMAATPAVVGDFATFWGRFRTAVLQGDTATISALSAPVVEQRGLLDSSPVIKLRPADVPAALAALGKAASGSEQDSGTVRDVLAATTDVPQPDTDTFARFEDYEFGRTEAGWRLTAIYYQPDEG